MKLREFIENMVDSENINITVKINGDIIFSGTREQILYYEEYQLDNFIVTEWKFRNLALVIKIKPI